MTRGLMGNWTFDIQDDFTTPDGTERAVYQTDDLENVHKDFAMKCKPYCLILTKLSKVKTYISQIDKRLVRP